MSFRFGQVSVPDGTSGKWSVSTFTIDKLDVMMGNLRAMRDGRLELICNPGTYRKLYCEGRGIVMSNTPMEITTGRAAFIRATGRVLVNGLGLGMVIEGILSKPDVTHVRVIEIESDVIEIVGKHFADDARVEIINADAYEYQPKRGERFDYVWHDIWDDINTDNLPSMARLSRKYARRCDDQSCWSREMLMGEKRRERQYAY